MKTWSGRTSISLSEQMRKQRRADAAAAVRQAAADMVARLDALDVERGARLERRLDALERGRR